MERVITHRTAGGIIFRRAQNLEFLVVKQIRWTGEIQWVCPKGHLEEGERAQDAAIREVAEEVGIQNIRNIKYIGDQRYSYREEGKENEKVVSWYLMEVGKEIEFVLNTKEGFVEAKWLPYEAAKSQFSYESFRTWLHLAIIAADFNF